MKLPFKNTLLCASLLVINSFWFGNASACQMGDTLSGAAHVIDGDTIDVALSQENADYATHARSGVPVVRVRLQGLHAQERDTEAGKAATAFMRALIEGESVSCIFDGTHTRKRCVGVCEFDGKDVALSLVEAGLGWSCDRFSERYRAHESEPRPRMPGYCEK